MLLISQKEEKLFGSMSKVWNDKKAKPFKVDVQNENHNYFILKLWNNFLHLFLKYYHWKGR